MSSPMPSRLRSATPTNNLSLRHLRRYEVQRHRRNSARENAVSFTSVAPNVRRLQTDLLAKSLTKAGCVGLVAVVSAIIPPRAASYHRGRRYQIAAVAAQMASAAL